MRAALGHILASVFAVCLGFGQETALTSLSYTPSFEPKFIDQSVDPCTNSYKFACGNWSKLNPIPADKGEWSVTAKLANENNRLLWGILQQASDPKANRTANEQKIGDFFHACMDEAAVERAGWKPLEPALAKIAAFRSINDLAPYIAEQQKASPDRGVLFALLSSPDFDNSSQEIAFASAGGFSLPDRDYYTKTDTQSEDIRQKYVQHIARMFQMLGESAAHARRDAKAAMEIETALAQSSLTRLQKRDPYNLKHKYSREELRRLVPRFDWDAYFTKLGAPAFEQLNVAEPKFFAEMNRQLSIQNLSAWRAYLRWRLLRLRAPYLSAGFVKEDFDFYNRYLEGVQQMPARWKTCTRLVDQSLGDALGQVFVAKTFEPQTRADVLKMTVQIEREMEQDIKDLQWMSDATRQHALQKLHGILNNIGYPEKWRDYSSVQISPDDFFGDVSRAFEFEMARQLNKIGMPVNRGEWLITPPSTDFYYNPKMNTINFPAGALQPPIYDPKMDPAPNYCDAGQGIRGFEMPLGHMKGDCNENCVNGRSHSRSE